MTRRASPRGEVSRPGDEGAALLALAPDLEHGGQGTEHDDRQKHVVKLLLNERQVAEKVSRRDEQHYPGNGAAHVEREEAPVDHLTHTGDERCEGAHDGHEAGDDDRLTAV